MTSINWEILLTKTCEANGLTPQTIEGLITEVKNNLFPGASDEDTYNALLITVRTRIERDNVYNTITASLLLDKITNEVKKVLGLGEESTPADIFKEALVFSANHELLSERALTDQFDYDVLAAALRPELDVNLGYLGLQTLYDRYFIHHREQRLEIPCTFFMRVAMGLAILEKAPTERAIEFYNLLTSGHYLTSTPTLFNSFTRHSQLSSCYLSTVPDDLAGIYDALKADALLSKYAGGLGNDWTPVRAMGAHIKGTNGKSQGVVPFLKVANDTAVAVNQCFDPDTPVYTATGIKRIADVKQGDLVIGKSGAYRHVLDTMTYDQPFDSPMVEIVSAYGDSFPTQVTDEHPFYTLRNFDLSQPTPEDWNSVSLEFQWVESGKLNKTDLIAQVIPADVKFTPGFSVDDFFIYGALFAAGGVHTNGNWFIEFQPNEYFEKRITDYLGDRSISFSAATIANRRSVSWIPTTSFPFVRSDLYDGETKRVFNPKFMHSPEETTYALVRGMLLSTAKYSERDERVFAFSQTLEILQIAKYQLLRIGVPANITKLDSDYPRYSLGFPPLDVIKGLLVLGNIPPLVKTPDFVRIEDHIFTAITDVYTITPVETTVDLIVDVDESYMTTSGLAHNGGKRKGAMCAYLESWHMDIEEFVELRKNTGDDRRRTHDMNTANWIPDLFMKRVKANDVWTLFSPNEVPDLHDLYGKAFEERYVHYEALAKTNAILSKEIRAIDLWRKMLSMLFETGHPWLTFKDPCNIRSPQQHCGVVHSSNLCTEITLNTKANEEIAVCNLGSINIAAYIDGNTIDYAALRRDVHTAVRMLDNVIDINYYAVPEAANSNYKHRPVGLGMMGFQDALYKRGVSYASHEAVAFADATMEIISYYAIEASCLLAQERGTYSSYKGSLWDRGIFPIDSVAMLKEERGGYCTMDQVHRAAEFGVVLDWDALRANVKECGMRNSNVMAIAPTATISNILGVTQSIEPTYQNLYVKSNLSGEFTVVNPYLVSEFKAIGIWDQEMVDALKLSEGSVQGIDRVPQYLKDLFLTAFEVGHEWLIAAAARRQKWIDQSQSLNLYIKGANGRVLDTAYMTAWESGLKTTYYLRALAATTTEKSTVNSSALNAVKATGSAPQPPTGLLGVKDNAGAEFATAAEVPLACSIDNPDCEACQ